MKKNQPLVEQWVHKFTSPAYMKFTPKEDFQLPQNNPQQSVFNKIRNYFSPPKHTPSSPNSSTLKKPNQQKTGNTLTFLKKLSSEDVLIGNEDQLDAIWVGGVVQDFVDTEFRWSINLGQAILHVAVDVKSKYLLKQRGL